jgi:hypothetical protein
MILKFRCLECQQQFQGQKEAAKHFEATGHTQFAENY